MKVCGRKELWAEKKRVRGLWRHIYQSGHVILEMYTVFIYYDRIGLAADWQQIVQEILGDLKLIFPGTIV